MYLRISINREGMAAVSVRVLQEAEAKMELDVQEIHWGLDMKNKGETSMETGPCERREGKKKAWAEDASDCLSQASGESLSKGHRRDGSHLRQKWPDSSIPAMHSHRLGAAWRERGLSEH